MTITSRPSNASSMLGGAITLRQNACPHQVVEPADPWAGEPGTTGRVAVVGAGKMGLPLCAQYAGHGWHVTAVDVNPAVVEAINAGRSHIAEEPGLAEGIAEAHAAGRLHATTDGAAAARESDVVVLIVPVMLDDESAPDYRWMDAAVASIGPGLRHGATVIFETTLPVGDTRLRFAPQLEELSGLRPDHELFVAFSPERLLSGHVFANLNTYPKLVGGIGPASTARAAAFYDAVLDAEVVAMSSAEAAEMSKLAETTYRDVNIAFANELGRAADRAGVDVQEVIEAANSQPYSHIHQPGIGVGGHCIPVYPHFLLARAPDLDLVALSRRINDGQVGAAVRSIEVALGGLDGVEVLVLGLTYRSGVHELAYSRALPLIDRLATHGAVVSAYDPLLSADEVGRLGARAWTWGTESRARAIVTQTADPAFGSLDWDWFPELALLYDGRNSLRQIALPPRVEYVGVGVNESVRLNAAGGPGGSGGSGGPGASGDAAVRVSLGVR